jgi:uncharacterized phiE125 gp8 family phage protein
MYIITPPTVEPVTIAEAALAARVDGAEWDDILTAAIKAARLVCEQAIGRRLMTTVERIELEDWPSSFDRFNVYRPTAVAVSYWNGSAWANLTSGTHYVWAADGYRFGLAPALNTSWPTLGDIAFGPRVRIDATSGESSAANVDEGAKTFIKALAAVMVKDPTLTATDAMSAQPLLRGLLDHLRV